MLKQRIHGKLLGKSETTKGSGTHAAVRWKDCSYIKSSYYIGRKGHTTSSNRRLHVNKPI